MAITDINISEQLETGAPSIKYTGKEGPRPSMQSQQEMMIAQQIWEAMGDEERGQFSNFQEFFRSGIWKQILQQAQQDEAQGIASLGPRNMEQGPRLGAEYGGRIGYAGGGSVITLMDGTKVQIPDGAYQGGSFKDIIYSSDKGDLLREEIIRGLSFAQGGRTGIETLRGIR